jgi:hypothetical protein
LLEITPTAKGGYFALTLHRAIVHLVIIASRCFMREQSAAVRLPLEGPLFALVEDWRRSQPKIPTRNEAIRLLLWQALEQSSAKAVVAVRSTEASASTPPKRPRGHPRKIPAQSQQGEAAVT